MKFKLLIAITALVFIYIPLISYAQENETAEEAEFEQPPPIDEDKMEATLTPELWKETLMKLDAAKRASEEKKVIQNLKETFWEIAGKDQQNYFLVVHSFFRQYPKLPQDFRSQYQDAFDRLYKKLEPVYIP